MHIIRDRHSAMIGEIAKERTVKRRLLILRTGQNSHWNWCFVRCLCHSLNRTFEYQFYLRFFFFARRIILNTYHCTCADMVYFKTFGVQKNILENKKPLELLLRRFSCSKISKKWEQKKSKNMRLMCFIFYKSDKLCLLGHQEVMSDIFISWNFFQH